LIFWLSKIVLGTGKNRLLRLSTNQQYYPPIHTHKHHWLMICILLVERRETTSFHLSLASVWKDHPLFIVFIFCWQINPLVHAPNQINQINGHLSSVKYHGSIVF